MLDAFEQFLTYALVAVTLENAVLSRSLGSSRLLILGRSVKGILVCGGVVTIATVATCLLAYPVNRLLDEYLSGSSWIGRLRPLLFMLITTAVYVGLYFANEKWAKPYSPMIRGIIPMVTLNCVVLGTALIVATGGLDFSQSMGYALGSGVGYTLAGLLIRAGQRRMELSEVPRAFRGMPITWIYIGLVALAFYGLVGHGLPT